MSPTSAYQPHMNLTPCIIFFTIPPPRLMKKTPFNCHDTSVQLHTVFNQNNINLQIIQLRKTIHNHTLNLHLLSIPNNPILSRTPLEIDKSEGSLPKSTQRLLAQLRAGKSPLLLSYLNHINQDRYPTPDCPLCTNAIEHTTAHLFNCPEIPTNLEPECLWESPVEAAGLLERWETARGGRW